MLYSDAVNTSFGKMNTLLWWTHVLVQRDGPCAMDMCEKVVRTKGKTVCRRVRAVSSVGECHSVGPTGKVTLEQRLEANEGVIQGFSERAVFWASGRAEPSPQGRVCLVCWRRTKGVSMGGFVGWGRWYVWVQITWGSLNPSRHFGFYSDWKQKLIWVWTKEWYDLIYVVKRPILAAVC